MSYKIIANKIAAKEKGVEHSTMMKSPCLRYKGDFMAMMFDKEDALIIKVSPQRVNEIIAEGIRKNHANSFKNDILISLVYILLIIFLVMMEWVPSPDKFLE